MSHRLFLRRYLCLLALAGLLGSGAALATDAPAPALVADSDVKVERSNGAFTVDLTVHAPVAPERAWAVLTDFEHMADFVPNLNSSQVSERSDSMLKVTQKGVAHYGIFSSHFESTREIHLAPPHEIRAHGVGGNIQRMESRMQLEAEGSGTRLTYHAEVLPGFWLPPLIGPSLVQHETAGQFSAMLQEMLRRQ
ncbi:SRPBCC family protein [Rhodoferax sp.]|uniref:SRPBCC family protein n=1 Tax=Rhodoferax sp. TaxID=50421 RepID=UPI00374D42EC